VPTITTASTLPAGVSLVDNGTGTAALTGTPGPLAGGVYSITLTATTGVGAPVAQIFTLTVYQAPAITSADNDTVTAEVAMKPFTVTVTAYPLPSLRASGLPLGVHLTNNFDGTGTITGTPKATASGVYHVSISAAGKSGSTTQAFTLEPLDAGVVVSSVTPTVGPSAGGTPVTLTGTGFVGATAVDFGGIPAAAFTIVSDTEITTTTPPGSVGPVDVNVTRAAGAATDPGAFTYVAVPTITGVSPAQGPTTGGTTITITGTALGGASALTFGTISATIVSDTDTQIIVSSPPGSRGPLDLSVTTPVGTATDPQAFAYVDSNLCADPATTNATLVPLADGAPYIIDCTLNVPAGVSLLVQRGVVVKFGSGDGIAVQGTLDAVGTSPSPIVFTSVNDNSVGGATGSGSPGEYDWNGVYLTGGSADLEWATFSYGRAGGNEVFGYPNELTMAHDTLDSGMSTQGTGPASVTQSSFQNNVRIMASSSTVQSDTVVGGGLYASSQTAPEVEGNSVTNPGSGESPAYWVDSPALDLSKLTGNTASGTGSLGFGLSGTLATSATWPAEPFTLLLGDNTFNDNRLDVPAGVTLTIEPGAVVKCEGGYSQVYSTAYTVTVEGTLDAVGTSASPIVFTSVNDNSVGGATGSGSPGEYDWNGVYLTGGSADLEWATFSYGRAGGNEVFGYPNELTMAHDTLDSGMSTQGTGPASVTQSSFQNNVRIMASSSTVQSDTVVGGGLYASSQTAPEVEGNSVTNPGSGESPAYWVDSPALDLSKLTGNTASGTGSLGFGLSGTLATSATWPAEPFTLLLGDNTFNDNRLDVPAGVTLTIEPGAVVKCEGGYSQVYSTAYTVTVEGTLDAVGTSASPIVFTSVNDNSVGGATGSGSPGEYDWSGVYLTGGSADLEWATFSYGRAEGNEEVFGYPNELTMAHATLDGGMSTQGTGPASVTQSSFQSDLRIVGSSSTVQSDTVVGGGLYASSQTAPEVEDNSVTDPGSGETPAYWVDSPALDLSKLTGNTASGTGSLGFGLSGTLATSATWPAEPFTLLLGDNTFNDNRLDIPAGVTLTIAPGAVVKCEGGSQPPYGPTYTLTVEGTLDAVGTSASPITFTSVNDNSVGGATGSGSPTEGDWMGIAGSTSASLDLEHTTVEYASTAANFAGGSESKVTIDSNTFSLNGTAVSVSAAVGTNASITNNAFTGNNVAINASSNWTTASIDPASCVYEPTMKATNNTFDGQDKAQVSESSLETIDALKVSGDAGLPVEEYPAYLGTDWTDDLRSSSTDVITWTMQPCIDVVDPVNSYAAVAIPLNLTGGTIIPFSF
jgi:urease beta subunit